jgi:hypothetical protein
MKALATVVGVLATALLAGLVAADGARANRLDVAARALREPGVWVDRDLRWLVGPSPERRVDRAIDRAGLPVRVAVLPQVAVDESRGDQRAIVRALMSRVSRDGLYVLVDQDGGLAYAARKLPLDVSEGSFRTRKGFDEASLSLDEVLDAIVPTLRAARAATPVSFEPYANPQGVVRSYDRDGDSLVGIAAGTLLLGSMLGFALYCCVRAAAGIVGLVRRRRHA